MYETAFKTVKGGAVVRRIISTVSLMLVVLAVISGSALGQALLERGDIRIIVVTHGTAADPFWSVVARGSMRLLLIWVFASSIARPRRST